MKQDNIFMYLSKHMCKFHSAWRNSIRKLFGIPNCTHGVLLNHLCDDIPVNIQVYKIFLNFFKSILSSTNVNYNMFALVVLNGSMSSTGNSLTYISNTSNIDKFKISNINVSEQLNQCIQPYETNCRKANFILDLISIKGNPSHNFEMSHINELINYLCIE